MNSFYVQYFLTVFEIYIELKLHNCDVTYHHDWNWVCEVKKKYDNISDNTMLSNNILSDNIMLSDNMLSDNLFFQPLAIMLSDNIVDNNDVIW
jgi:hypothetical protein